MRGVLSAGSLLAVDVLGFRHVFDEVYATSAGGVNAAYFLSGQGALGITVYFDSINNRQFMNWLRFTKIVDVEFVYDHIVTDVKPLDEDAIRRGKTHFFLSVTNAETGKNELLDVRRHPHSIPTMLKASSALPVLYNRTVRLGGTDYVDGGLTNPIPIQQAISRGCTDILVLLTKRPEHVSRPCNVAERVLFRVCMGWKYPALGAAYRTSHFCANESRKLAFGEGAPESVNIATICPSRQDMLVGKTTLKREKLLNGAYQLARKTFKIFDGDESVLDKMFHEFGRVSS